jgi:hypothetical protein
MLGAIAAERVARGRVFVVCSHDGSCRAFDRALREHQDARGEIIVDTLAGHLARMMRADYASAHVSPDFAVGGPGAGSAVVEKAARGLLDLTWPELRDGSIDLDLPFARRPGALLEAATSLYEQLRRSRIAPSEFETGCAEGLAAFYGDDVERAREHLTAVQRKNRGSKRARESMRASDDVVRVQRRAERDLVRVLAHVYRDSIAVARSSSVKSDAEVIGFAMDWLASEPAAAARAFARCDAILVDDAEDGEPALTEFLAVAAAAGVPYVAVAGWEASAVDELHGRRSFVQRSAAESATGVPAPLPVPEAHRFTDENAESDWIADRIADLLRRGVRPDEVAVLSRDRDAALIYARHLAARGLPALPPADAYAAPDDIADLFALASVVDNPYDHARLLRVLASPLVGFSDATMWTLCRDASASAQLSLDVGGEEGTRARDRAAVLTRLADNVLYGGADSALPEGARAVMRQFRDRFAGWRAACSALAPAEAFELLVRDSGFARRWCDAPAFATGRLFDDAERIAGALATAVRCGAARGLRAALDAVESGIVEPRLATRSEAALVCDGIVEVKGERFAHVIVAGVAHERFPRIYVSRPMAFSRKYGLIVRDNVADAAPQTAKYAWYYARFEAKGRYLDGERRALRYGLSRAIESAAVTGYGTPPHWAKDEDLLAPYL